MKYERLTDKKWKEIEEIIQDTQTTSGTHESASTDEKIKMDKEKEIMDMAQEIYERGVALSPLDFVYGVSGDDHFTRIAKYLSDEGYGNVKEAVKKFTDRLIALYENEEGDETHYSTPCPVIIQNIKDIRDEFLTELYGTSCETCPNNNNAEYNEGSCPMRENCGRK